MTQLTQVTPDQVAKAYEALATGDKERIREYWADDLQWLVPGHNQLSGWKNGLEEFLEFMATVGKLSGNSFNMESIALVTSGEYSADETRNTGRRADDPRTLDIDVIHLLRWRDGKVVEGKGAIFGDGTAQYDAFWA
jgi:ketosteroid isomerase-like protein